MSKMHVANKGEVENLNELCTYSVQYKRIYCLTTFGVPVCSVSANQDITDDLFYLHHLPMKT